MNATLVYISLLLSEGWLWSVIGLVLSLVGVVLLFRYGMPYRVRTGGQPIRVVISHDQQPAALEKRYDKLGKLGLLLVIVGTVFQIVGSYLSAL
jgi:hypothetical protein